MTDTAKMTKQEITDELVSVLREIEKDKDEATLGSYQRFEELQQGLADLEEKALNHQQWRETHAGALAELNPQQVTSEPNSPERVKAAKEAQAAADKAAAEAKKKGKKGDRESVVDVSDRKWDSAETPTTVPTVHGPRTAPPGPAPQDNPNAK